MASLRISLAHADRLRWPSACAVCGAPANDHAAASVTTNNDFHYTVLLKWTKRTVSVPFPVCRKHRILCRLMDIPAMLGFIDACLYLLILVPIILLLVSGFLVSIATGLTGSSLDPYAMALASLFYGSMVLFIVAAATLKPVKLSAINQTSLTISIRNKEYFKAFQRLNSTNN